MEETYLLNVEGVKKKILHGGQGELPKFQDGSKITFHFQTLKDNFERTVIDDSREAGIPMEIIVGKMFKMEIWETLLSSMRAGEVAEFWCDAIHTGMYALVSKGMRRIAEGRDPLEGQKHRCGMGNMFDYHSTGYDDLDELQRTPQPLIFIMELFRVEEPSAYKRDTWAMSKEEKLAAVPVLHSEGNRLVLRKEFRQAAAKYQEAVICLRNLQAKEKPWEDGWLKLESLVTPLVLNYCQCQLELGEYYEVLEHTTELLQKHKDNAKAYFKRAKAHAAVWNEREAREDFLRVADLDPAMAAAVKKELKQLGERMRKKHVEDRKRYQGLFQQPQGPRAGKGAAAGSGGQEGEGERQQGEVGVLETQGGEQDTGVGPSGADEEEQGNPGDGHEEEAPGGDAAPGEPAEVRDGMGQGEEANLGTCGAEPESCGAGRGTGEEDKETAEEEEEEEEDKEIVEEEEEMVVEEEEGEKEAVEEKVVVEEEEEEKEVVVEEEEAEKGTVEREEEGEKETVEEVKEEEEEEEEKVEEEENPAAELEKLSVGHKGAAGLVRGPEQGAGGAERTGAGSMAGDEPGRAPEPDQGTSQEEQGQESCGGHRAGRDSSPPAIAAGEVLYAGPSGADQELAGGAEVPPCPTPAGEGDGAPLGQCRESRELRATALGHGHP
uniref:AIP/AIPL N-terminal FKBP-type PPIase domain-containing protein n=1 Tax=Anser brachyrhynchus TaxID=132585 RepID=A0A8B9CUP7_9AVES